VCIAMWFWSLACEAKPQSAGIVGTKAGFFYKAKDGRICAYVRPIIVSRSIPQIEFCHIIRRRGVVCINDGERLACLYGGYSLLQPR
jgi:hypothetical protein